MDYFGDQKVGVLRRLDGAVGGLAVQRTEFLIADQSKDAQDLMIDYLATTDATGELPLYNATRTRDRSNRAVCLAARRTGGVPPMVTTLS